MSADPVIMSSLRRTMASVSALQVPYAWLQPLGNHTAAIVLADILAAYSVQRGDRAILWDGQALILEYKEMATRLGISERSVSRNIELLTKQNAITYRRKDRVVGNRKTRNVVGVIPNVDAISKLSGNELAATSAASQGGIPPHVRRRRANASAPEAENADTIYLTEFQESLLRAFEDDFEEIVGLPYKTSSDQRLADLRAVASITILKARGAGHEYLVWSRQYLEALKAKAQRSQSDVRDLAHDRAGNARAAYTIEVFVQWAKTEDPLPTGFARRSFKRAQPGGAKSP